MLEARAERQAIDAFVNEVGLHVEREDKFACVLSLHGSQLRTHPNLLLDAPAIPVRPALPRRRVVSQNSLSPRYDGTENTLLSTQYREMTTMRLSKVHVWDKCTASDGGDLGSSCGKR